MRLHSLARYKAMAGRICDAMIQHENGRSRQSPYITAQLSILKTRKTKGARAAVLTGLVVGALVERGRPDLAEQVIIEIAKLAGMTGE